jgi:hypothetical protein
VLKQVEDLLSLEKGDPAREDKVQSPRFLSQTRIAASAPRQKGYMCCSCVICLRLTSRRHFS